MPDNKKDNDEKLKEMLEIINVLKENNDDQEEIEILENLINTLIKANNRSLFSTILLKISGILLRIIIGIILSLTIFGFMKDSIILDNKWLIIVIAFIISLVLIIYDHIYWYKYDPNNKSYIPISIFILLMGLAFILNSSVIKIFVHSSMWLFYLPLARILYKIIDGYFMKKFPTL